PAHPETKRPEWRHFSLSGEVCVFIQDVFRFSYEEEKICLIISQHHIVGSIKIFSEVDGNRRRSVHKHAVTPAAHIKRNWLIHCFILNTIGVIYPQDHFLTTFVELGERFSKTKYFFSRFQA